MTEDGGAGGWLVVLVRLPAGPSRHRVAVWRELRRVGAISLAGGVWTAPAVPLFADGIARAATVAVSAGGDVLTLHAAGTDDATRRALRAEFDAARSAEWVEFVAECGKFHDEIAKERRIGKVTLAELDEEEQNLDRLRRWARDLRARDVFAVPEGRRADELLAGCTQLLDGYAAEVYRAVHAPLEQSHGLVRSAEDEDA